MTRRRKPQQPLSLSEQLHRLLMSVLLPVGLIIALLVSFVFSYSSQYTAISRTIAEVSGFNRNFKDDVDLKMYYYVIGSTYSEGLPVNEVDAALELAKTLKQSTENRDSLKAIDSVLSLCENLKSRLYQIEATPGYDERISQLESNVYVLTGLIQQYMYAYLYYEAGQMAEMQALLSRQLWLELSAVLLGTILLMIVLWRRVVRISRDLTQPIDTLCRRVEEISRGELSPREPLRSGDPQLQTLSESFEQMVASLNQLLEHSSQEQIRLRNMEFALLQAQINPHFLYNTLDTILWLIETRKNDQAVEMITSLSNFFRSSLSKGRDVITLAEEFVHVRSYLEIQQVRYKDILHYDIRSDPSLNECRVPKLTLQPLVENALYHGIKNKRGVGTICVSSHLEGENAVLSVSDTGAGMTPERLQEVLHSMDTDRPAGFGMGTVSKRLHLLYGEDCRFEIASTPGQGTTIRITIPARPR